MGGGIIQISSPGSYPGNAGSQSSPAGQGKRGAEFPKGSFPTRLNSCFQPLSGDISVFPGERNSPTTPAIFQKPWTPRLLPHPSVSTAAVHHRHIQQSQANKGRPSPRKAPSAYAGRVKKHPDQTFIRRSSRTARIYPGHSSRLPSSPDFRINHETY